MELILIILIVAVVVMSAISYYIGRRSASSNDQRKELEFELQRSDELRRALAERESKIEVLQQQVSRLSSERDVQSATAEQLRSQLEERAKEYNERSAVLREQQQSYFDKQLASIKESYESQLRQVKEHSEGLMMRVRDMNKEQVETQFKLIQEQMQSTSERVLKERQEQLDAHNVENVSKIVNPLRDSLNRMSEALDVSKREHQESMTRLDATIQANMRNSIELGERAERLANALTGEVKVQGNFGELRLRKLFEDLGLEEGSHFTTQQALKDRFGNKIKSDEEKNLIPDFILHFPNNRDVIVDSKVNLTAYEQYVNAETPEEKTSFLAAHIKAVRSQVDNLARKDYSAYLDTNYAKLNFVIMYMFQESALNLALLNDTGLWRYAYDKGVLILGPQTMYMNLRILELMWVQMRQLSKQREMIEAAELIVERTQLFAKRLNATYENMQKVVREFDSLRSTTADSGKSIITPARNLISLGVKQKKNMLDLNDIFVDEDSSRMIGEQQDDDHASESLSSAEAMDSTAQQVS